ncbi:MAG: peptide deformylase [Deltaproteobacteria bacterium]|nr:peptide deformylase [Deltaproteobacteria bacterium]
MLMALLQVHEFPDPILQQHAMPVTVFDDKLRQLAADMLETMYEERGIGLAANQVAVLKQIVVVDVMAGDADHGQREPQVLVNPKIVAASGETAIEEGCLSVPEFRAEVPRAEKIKVEYQDLEGQPQTLEADGLLAICLQHEFDHLRGRLFIDYLPPLKQRMVKKRLAKLARMPA